MIISIKTILNTKINQGKCILKVKSELCKAKKSGVIFFNKDVSILTEKEDIDLYYSGLASSCEKKEAFPVKRENFVMPANKNDRFELFKKNYELYYTDCKMDYELFTKFSSIPYKGEKYLWFYRNCE